MKKILPILFITMVMSMNNSFAQKLTWHTDMSKASEISIKEKKPLLMFFTGSDWCGWCIRLQNQVLKTKDFKQWAEKNVILVELDFPRKKVMEKSIQIQNQQLQQLFKVRGYPTIVFAVPEKTDEGKMNLNNLGRTGFVKGGAEKWLEVANTIIKAN